MIQPRPADGSNPPERFFEYHALGFQDEIMNLDHLLDSCEKVILTGRPVRYRSMSLDWLKRHGIVPLFSLFRNAHDTRPSRIVKKEMMEWLLSDNMYAVKKPEIIDAIDDLTEVIEVYITMGIPARIVRIGEEEHIA